MFEESIKKGLIDKDRARLFREYDEITGLVTEKVFSNCGVYTDLVTLYTIVTDEGEVFGALPHHHNLPPDAGDEVKMRLERKLPIAYEYGKGWRKILSYKVLE